MRQAVQEGAMQNEPLQHHNSPFKKAKDESLFVSLWNADHVPHSPHKSILAISAHQGGASPVLECIALQTSCFVESSSRIFMLSCTDCADMQDVHPLQ